MADPITHVQLQDYHAATADPNEPFVDLPFEMKAAGRLKVTIGSYVQVERPRGYAHIPFVYTLFEPSGSAFLGDTITMALLDKYRDNRGCLNAKWKLRLHPAPAQLVNGPSYVAVVPGSVQVAVEEASVSESAAPVIPAQRILRTGSTETLQLDLYRMGELRVRTWSDIGPLNKPTRGLWFTLFDPDGIAKTTGRDSTLKYTIKDRDLGKCRDEQGRPRLWSLKVEKGPGFVAHGPFPLKIEAQVFAVARIPQEVLGSRLNTLLQPNGRPAFRMALKWNATRRTTQVVIRFAHERTLETLDMHGLLDGLPEHLNQGVDTHHPQVGVDYVLMEKATLQDLSFDLPTATLGVINLGEFGMQPKNFVISSVEVRLKPTTRRVKLVPIAVSSGSVRYEEMEVMPGGLPGLEVKLQSTGTLKLIVPAHDDAEVALTRCQLDVGFQEQGGAVAVKTWLDPDSIQWGGEEGEPHGLSELIDFWTSDALTIIRELAEGLVAMAIKSVMPKALEVVLGGRFTITNTTWSAGAIAFEYIPPVEPERAPTMGYRKAGAGPQGPGTDRLVTNAAEKILKDRVDHVVVLMMENRSFDHVLGYRSLLGINDDVDGLTDNVIKQFTKNARSRDAFEKEIFRWLGDPDFKHGGRDPVFTPATKLPYGVGHEFSDVGAQLADGTMTGFVSNFKDYISRGFPGSQANKERAMRQHMREHGVRPYDVMGYYTDADLPMYGYLADQFGICDRFFCSHPGPTMPNRMYSLTGNLFINRFREPQMDNGTEGGIRLSRATTIFDILSQQGVSWRVYESPPSVSMLRYFARYAGAPDTEIRDVKEFAEDARKGRLPSVTFIDPAYHHAPPNDDHPPADMLRGQHFIKSIYDALRSNQSAWERTLFVITYDEHGGLFDHVSPPVAEVWGDPRAPRSDDRFEPGRATVGGAARGPRRIPRPRGLQDVLSGVREIAPLPGSSAPRYKPDVEVKYGVRVPTFLISPYVEPGTVRHEVWDFAAILKTILVRFCGNKHPFLSDRVHASGTFAPALSRETLRTDIDASPSLRRPAPFGGTRAQRERYFTKGAITKHDADWHEFMSVLGRMTRG